MDIIDFIDIPSFERKRSRFRRGISAAVGLLAAALVIEKYNGGISRVTKSVRRGLTAALAAWLEDRGGIALFTVADDDDSMPGSISALDLRKMLQRQQSLDRRGSLVGSGGSRRRLSSQSEDVAQPSEFEAPVVCATIAEDVVAESGGSTHGPAGLLTVGHGPSPYMTIDPSTGILTRSSDDHHFSADTPQFFQSTKFFAVLDVEEAKELFQATSRMQLEPNEVLFKAGDLSDSGIFIVVRGSLGIFLDDGSPVPAHANTLRYGESVGDLDVVDGAARTVTAIALEEGCLLVQVPRQLFVEFVAEHPRALLLYLQQGLARLWRVAHFTLGEFLHLQLHKKQKQLQGTANGPAGASCLNISERRENGVPQVSVSTQTFDDQSKSISSAYAATSSGTQEGYISSSIPLALGDIYGCDDLRGSLAMSTAEENIKSFVSAKGKDEPGLPSSSPLDIPPTSGSNTTSTKQLLRGRTGSLCRNPGPLPPSPGFKEFVNLVPPPGSTTPKLISSNLNISSSSSLGPQTSKLPYGMGMPSAKAIEGATKALGGSFRPSLSGTPQVNRSEMPLMPEAVFEESVMTTGSPAFNPASVSAGFHTKTPVDSTPATFNSSQSTNSSQGTAPLNRMGSRLRPQAPFVMSSRACLADGWDVVDLEESSSLSDRARHQLSDPKLHLSQLLPLPKGGLLQDQDWACGQFYLLVEGHLMATRKSELDEAIGSGAAGPPSAGAVWSPALGSSLQESAVISPGSIISAAAFLSSTSCRSRVVALETCRLAAFGWQQLEDMAAAAPSLLVQLLLAAATAMGPLIRRFVMLGLNRVWLKSGDVAYRQGDEAACLFVVISGRLRLLHESRHLVTGQLQLQTEEEVGRGEAVGAVWAITGGCHDTTAMCVRDSELVRMSKNAFKVMSHDSPLALSSLFSNIARRLTAARDSRLRGLRVGEKQTSLGGAYIASSGTSTPSSRNRPRIGAPGGPSPSTSRVQRSAGAPGSVPGATPRGEIVTIAVLPAGFVPLQTRGANRSSQLINASMNAPGVASLLAVKRLANALKESLSSYGPVLQLNSTSIGLLFPTAFEKLDILFYRSKITSWLSSQEEEYRFIILEGDVHVSPWSSVCSAQADCILLVAAEGAQPKLGPVEAALVFGASGAVGGSGSPLMGGITPVASLAHISNAPALHVAGGEEAVHPHHRRPSTAGMPPPAAGPHQFAEAPSMSQLMHGGSGARWGTGGAGGGSTSSSKHVSEQPISHHQGLPSMSDPGKSSGDAGGATHHVNARAPAGSIDTPASTPAAAFTSFPPLVSGGYLSTAFPGCCTAQLRRAELVLLHPLEDEYFPEETLEWLWRRPHLARHHHVRLGIQSDMDRLSRWMAGKAVGLVLSGGGSRGLAHLGVLCALEDLGVPVDVIGGTSQGAFMAALYAQGLSREQLQLKVHEYASQMGSMRHLLSDLTLPVLSVFSGAGFDQSMQRIFSSGAQLIEDLWLPYFCVSTNLTKGEPAIHTKGTLWRLVRASMTIVGLLPPVYEEGEGLLVDGGYMNNIPVDVMRSMGVDTVIVVDVESKDDSGWRNLMPYAGGVSGWQILWDRWCPISSWRSNMHLPKYSQIINQLTWMTHAHNLKRVSQEHKIDLYLRPPNIGSIKLMDFHLMNRIVKDSYKYAITAIAQWKMLAQVSTSRSNSIDGRPGATPTPISLISETLVAPKSSSAATKSVLPDVAAAAAATANKLGGGGGPKSSTSGASTLLDPTTLRLALATVASSAAATIQQSLSSLNAVAARQPGLEAPSRLSSPGPSVMPMLHDPVVMAPLSYHAPALQAMPHWDSRGAPLTIPDNVFLAGGGSGASQVIGSVNPQAGSTSTMQELSSVPRQVHHSISHARSSLSQGNERGDSGTIASVSANGVYPIVGAVPLPTASGIKTMEDLSSDNRKECTNSLVDECDATNDSYANLTERLLEPTVTSAQQVPEECLRGGMEEDQHVHRMTRVSTKIALQMLTEEV